MGRELSLSALFELRSASPPTAIVILTMEDDPAFVAPGLERGRGRLRAQGGVAHRARAGDPDRGQGGRYLDPAIGGWALTSADDAALTERELEVLRLVALGYTNSEIAKPHVHQSAHGRDPPRQPPGASSGSPAGPSSSATRSSTG